MTSEITALRLAGGAQGFNWLPVFVAEETGLFAGQGLAVEYLRLGSVDKATAAVLAEEADLAITPPEGAIANFVAGGELRILASNSNRLPMSVIAQPEITSAEGLRGKTVGTSSLTEGTAIYTQLFLSRYGLAYPADYGFALAGVHTARWEALRKREIDCAPQPAPWNVLAEDEGFSRLGELSDAIPEIVFAALVGKRSRIGVAGDALRRLMRALIEAHTFVNDPANDATTLPIYRRLTLPDHPDLARRGLDYTRDLGMWPEGLAIPERALTTTIDVMVRAGLLPEDRREAATGVFESALLCAAAGG